MREHRALGHRTVLITGALDFAVDGLRPLFDEIIAAEMTRQGPTARYRGEMVHGAADRRGAGPDPGRLLRRRRARLDECVAYADSTSDLPMLEAVGFPVAVNPETRLAALARKRGWLVEHWSKASGGPRPLLLFGPLMVERERRRRFGVTSIHPSTGCGPGPRGVLGWPQMLGRRRR